MENKPDILDEITWKCQPFSKLSLRDLYHILQLRNEVFVVEQNCPYQDCDEKDFDSHHLTAWVQHQLVAYARLLPVGISYKNHAAIGRVVTSPRYRNLKIGRQLMHYSISEIYKLFGEVDICLSAQYHLRDFYISLSFVPIGSVYLEDGIEHIAMVLIH